MMELCKENLMKHILQDAKNVPGVPSSTPATCRKTIRLAKEITVALEFLHSREIVHRELKLENILVRYIIIQGVSHLVFLYLSLILRWS